MILLAQARVPDDLTKWFRGKVEKHNEMVEQVFREGAALGEQIIKDRIETAGTGREWEGNWETAPHGTAGRHSSDPGRDASGEMKSAVHSWYSTGKDGKSRMAFGWTNPSQRKEYFLFQEGGFDHAITGEHIEGMYAVSDAAQFVFDYVHEELDRRMK